MNRSDKTPNADGGTEWRVIEQRPYDRSSPVELTTAVLKTVAAAEGTDAAGIRDPPLYEVVDTTAIEDGFFGREVAGERRDTVGGVHFQYRGFRVTVRSDGWVQVAEPVEMEG